MSQGNQDQNAGSKQARVKTLYREARWSEEMHPINQYKTELLVVKNDHKHRHVHNHGAQ